MPAHFRLLLLTNAWGPVLPNFPGVSNPAGAMHSKLKRVLGETFPAGGAPPYPTALRCKFSVQFSNKYTPTSSLHFV
jgi:hypothetical protein